MRDTLALLAGFPPSRVYLVDRVSHGGQNALEGDDHRPGWPVLACASLLAALSSSRLSLNSLFAAMDQAVARKTLQELIKREDLDNKKCIDCANPNPQWASLR